LGDKIRKGSKKAKKFIKNKRDMAVQAKTLKVVRDIRVMDDIRADKTKMEGF
jgi:hypothetical protein